MCNYTFFFEIFTIKLPEKYDLSTMKKTNVNLIAEIN